MSARPHVRRDNPIKSLTQLVATSSQRRAQVCIANLWNTKNPTRKLLYTRGLIANGKKKTLIEISVAAALTTHIETCSAVIPGRAVVCRCNLLIECKGLGLQTVQSTLFNCPTDTVFARPVSFRGVSRPVRTAFRFFISKHQNRFPSFGVCSVSAREMRTAFLIKKFVFVLSPPGRCADSNPAGENCICVTRVSVGGRWHGGERQPQIEVCADSGSMRRDCNVQLRFR